jgi:hypothetical protein
MADPNWSYVGDDLYLDGTPAIEWEFYGEPEGDFWRMFAAERWTEEDGIEMLFFEQPYPLLEGFEMTTPIPGIDATVIEMFGNFPGFIYPDGAGSSRKAVRPRPGTRPKKGRKAPGRQSQKSVVASRRRPSV